MTLASVLAHAHMEHVLLKSYLLHHTIYLFIYYTTKAAQQIQALPTKYIKIMHDKNYKYAPNAALNTCVSLHLLCCL